MTEEQKASALQAVFNRTSLKGVNLILSEGVDAIKGYKEELENADGAASDMAETMQDNLQGSMDKFKSAAEGLGIAIYDGIKEPLTDVVDFGANVLSGLTDVFDGADTNASQQWADGIKSAAEEAADAVDSMKDKISSARSSYEAEETAAAKVKLLGDQLVTLMNTEDRTAVQTATMHNIIKELGGYIPEITEAYNEQTGVLDLTTDAVKNLTQAQSGQMLENAKAKMGSEALDAMVEASAKLNAAITASEEAAAKKGAWDSYIEELQHVYDAFSACGGAIDETTPQVQEAARVAGEMFKDGAFSAQEYADALNALPGASKLLEQAVKDQKIGRAHV